MDINEIDYEDLDDLGYEDPEDFLNQENKEEHEYEEERQSNEESALETFLKNKGISDIHKIKFEEDDGEVKEYDWDDLSKEEQLNILTPELEDQDLDDSEIDLINRIRLAGMSVEDYIESIRLQGVAFANSQNQEESYIVDDLSDDELYLLDLQTRLEDISDEELYSALENAKSNPDFFLKNINALREEYKRLEVEKNEREEALNNQQRLELYELLSNAVVLSINGFTNIGELDVTMDEQDAQELSNFILGTDPAGVNYFSKALNDPDTLVRMAWFALHGEDVINSISDYYKSAIATSNKNSYQKGYLDAKDGVKPTVVVDKKKQLKNTVKSIDDFVY